MFVPGRNRNPKANARLRIKRSMDCVPPSTRAGILKLEVSAKTIVTKRAKSEYQTPESETIVLLVNDRVAAGLPKHIITLLRIIPYGSPCSAIPFCVKTTLGHLKKPPHNERSQFRRLRVLPNVGRSFKCGGRLHEDERPSSGTAAGRALAPATTALWFQATAKAQSAAAVACSVLLGCGLFILNI